MYIMWLKKIKQKTLQYFLTAFILFFATIILSGCLIFTIESNHFLTEFYSRENNADFYGFLTDSAIAKKIKKEAELESFITKCEVVEGVMVNNVMYQIEENSYSAFLMFLLEVKNRKDSPMQIFEYEGILKDSPADDEIWITKIFADTNHVSIGDKIKFKNTALTVTAIVLTPLSPSSLLSCVPLFISTATKEKLQKEYSELSLLLLNSMEGEKQSDDFVRDKVGSNMDAMPLSFTLSAVDSSIRTASTILGGIGILGSFMIFLVSLIVIKYIIRSNLQAEYKSIGIHKALGNTNRYIKGIYQKSFIFVSSFGIILGALMGILIAKYMGNILFVNLKSFELSYLTIVVILAIIVLLLLTLLLNINATLKSISKITPVQALRAGISSTKKKITKSLIKNAHSSFSMAVNDIFKHKGNSLLIILMLTTSFYLSMTFINMYYSCNSIAEYPERWFSLSKADAIISGNLGEEVFQYLETSDLVKSYQRGQMLTNFDISCKENLDLDITNLSAIIYDTYEEKLTGIKMKKGRAPLNGHEIAISYEILANSNVEIGDYISLTIMGTEESFLVTGTYRGIMNDGKSILFQSEIYDIIGVTAEQTPAVIDSLYIYFNEKTDYNTFFKKIENRIDGIAVTSILPQVETSADSLIEIVSPVTLVLVFVFILFSVLNIFNLMAMEQLKNRKQFGILKSLGFTNQYICFKCIWKTIILLLTALICSLIFYTTTVRTLFETAVGVDAFITSIPLTVMILCIIFGLELFVTLIFCIPLKKTMPTVLMEE